MGSCAAPSGLVETRPCVRISVELSRVIERPSSPVLSLSLPVLSLSPLISSSSGPRVLHLFMRSPVSDDLMSNPYLLTGRSEVSRVPTLRRLSSLPHLESRFDGDEDQSTGAEPGSRRRALWIATGPRFRGSCPRFSYIPNPVRHSFARRFFFPGLLVFRLNAAQTGAFFFFFLR